VPWVRHAARPRAEVEPQGEGLRQVWKIAAGPLTNQRFRRILWGPPRRSGRALALPVRRGSPRAGLPSPQPRPRQTVKPIRQAARIQAEVQRRLGPERRLQIAFELSAATHALGSPRLQAPGARGRRHPRAARVGALWHSTQRPLRSWRASCACSKKRPCRTWSRDRWPAHFSLTALSPWRSRGRPGSTENRDPFHVVKVVTRVTSPKGQPEREFI
jgi:hypothetical protein